MATTNKIKIKLLVGLAGPIVYQSGQEVVFDKLEAERLIEAGFAEKVKTTKKANTES